MFGIVETRMVGSELTIFSNIIGAFITQVYGDLLGSPQYRTKFILNILITRYIYNIPRVSSALSTTVQLFVYFTFKIALFIIFLYSECRIIFYITAEL